MEYVAVESLPVSRSSQIDHSIQNFDNTIRPVCKWRSRRFAVRIGRANGSSANPNRMRYGYRRVHVMLQRDGWQHNIKKTYRIYKVSDRPWPHCCLKQIG
jgi:hypothetical protein